MTLHRVECADFSLGHFLKTGTFNLGVDIVKLSIIDNKSNTKWTNPENSEKFFVRNTFF